MSQNLARFEPKLEQIRQFLEDFRDFSVIIDEFKDIEKAIFEAPYSMEEVQGGLLDIIFKVASFIEEMEIAIAEDSEGASNNEDSMGEDI